MDTSQSVTPKRLEVYHDQYIISKPLPSFLQDLALTMSIPVGRPQHVNTQLLNIGLARVIMPSIVAHLFQTRRFL